MLAEFIKIDTKVEYLSIKNNNIGPRGAYALASVFENGKNKTLTHLDLHGNRILHKGAVALAKSLRQAKHNLNFLDVSNNHIGFQGVLRLQFAASKVNSSRSTSKLVIKDLSESKTQTHVPPPKFTLNVVSNFVIEETWNSISHGVGFILSLIATIMTVYSAKEMGWEKLLGCTVYCASLLFLYFCSSLYHSFFKLGTTKAVFQRLDHAAIFVLIAGSYTPVLLGGPLDGFYGRVFLIFVWCIAFIGIFLVCFYFDRFPMVELSLYLAMGWCSVVVVPVVYEHWEELVSGKTFHIHGLYWYAVGGLVYTTGVYFFIKGNRIPIHHAVWHVFVVVASICHFIGCYYYVLPTPPPPIPYW